MIYENGECTTLPVCLSTSLYGISALPLQFVFRAQVSLEAKLWIVTDIHSAGVYACFMRNNSYAYKFEFLSLSFDVLMDLWSAESLIAHPRVETC